MRFDADATSLWSNRIVQCSFKLRTLSFQSQVVSPRDGYVASVNSMEVGLVGVLLGAGRKTVDESVDFTAGIWFRKKAGMLVCKGDVLAEVYTERGSALEGAVQRVLEAFSFAEEKVVLPPLITNMVTKDGVEEYDQSILTDD